jgi:hypothetical protein
LIAQGTPFRVALEVEVNGADASARKSSKWEAPERVAEREEGDAGRVRSALVALMRGASVAGVSPAARANAHEKLPLGGIISVRPTPAPPTTRNEPRVTRLSSSTEARRRAVEVGRVRGMVSVVEAPYRGSWA